jgi:hypothetical protein
MGYYFELAFEQSGEHQGPLYIDGKQGLPANSICVIPVSNEPGDVNLLSDFRAANKIRPGSNIPNFKQYGQRIVMDDCNKLASVMH